MTTFEASRGNRGHQMMTKELSAKIPKLYSQEEVSDPTVVAHYFTPYGRGDWFVIEWDGQDLMYGLADLGYPELGYFSLSELESAYRGSLPLVERDLYWTPVPLSEVKKTRMSAETFEAPKTMTKSQAKKKFVALAQPYWIKSMTSIKQTFEKEEKKYPFLLDSYPPSKVADKYLKMAKSGRFRALEWDYSDLVPDGFYNLVTYDRNDYDTWETTAAYFEGPKSVQKQLKALLPFIEGKVTVKPKAQKTTTRKSKPKAKANKGFVWEYYDYGDDPRTKAAQESYGKYAGRFTIGPAVKKAQKDGWKRVSYNSKYGPRIWSRMAKTPQWKPWVKDLTARSKYERHIMGETIDVLNGTARWKKSGDYSPDHMGEDGDWEILTKDNKIMLLYYYADDELSTRLMRKTFTTSTTPKPRAKASAKKTTTRKSKPKAKTGRKGPDISATKRKIGTRMRGNDGNMWEVKPAGKSQRWVRGAEGKSPDGFNKSLVAIDLEYEGIEYCDYFIVPTNQISGFSEQELVSYFYDLEEEDWADENTFEPMMSHATEVLDVMVSSLTPEEEKVLIKFGISGRYL